MGDAGSHTSHLRHHTSYHVCRETGHHTDAPLRPRLSCGTVALMVVMTPGLEVQSLACSLTWSARTTDSDNLCIRGGAHKRLAGSRRWVSVPCCVHSISECYVHACFFPLKKK